MSRLIEHLTRLRILKEGIPQRVLLPVNKRIMLCGKISTCISHVGKRRRPRDYCMKDKNVVSYHMVIEGQNLILIMRKMKIF